MELKKRVTIKQAIAMIMESDPNTAISRRHIREVVPMLPGTIYRGNRWLPLWDEIVEYFNDPTQFEIVDDGEKEVFRRKETTRG